MNISTHQVFIVHIYVCYLFFCHVHVCIKSESVCVCVNLAYLNVISISVCNNYLCVISISVCDTLQVFVELDELHAGTEDTWEWREKARWIKFEEDVEEGADRWGKPHVASLSFHSLLELRRGLENGNLSFKYI